MRPFTELLKDFNLLVADNTPAKAIADKLNYIKTEASSSNIINSRQKEAIIARVNNYINNNWGKKSKNI